MPAGMISVTTMISMPERISLKACMSCNRKGIGASTAVPMMGPMIVPRPPNATYSQMLSDTSTSKARGETNPT